MNPKYKVCHPGLAENLSQCPLDMEDLYKIYDVFGVKLKKTAKARREWEPVCRQHGESARKFKRRLYAEHQRLYALGPKVLLEELIAGTRGLGPVSLDEIHAVFDPILTDPSPLVPRVGHGREQSLGKLAPVASYRAPGPHVTSQATVRRLAFFGSRA